MVKIDWLKIFTHWNIIPAKGLKMKFRCIYLLLSTIVLFGCDSDKITIEGIIFNKEEITQIEQRKISREYIQSTIQEERKNGKSDQEIKTKVLNINGFDSLIDYIEETSQQDKNRFYEACYQEYSKAIKTLDDKEFIVKYCNCAADCILNNVKWVNNMPISLSEEDEKDKGKVDIAWVHLTKKCRTTCLDETKKQNNKK